MDIVLTTNEAVNLESDKERLALKVNLKHMTMSTDISSSEC